ncbi:MAG: helix-turn-helix domain-containing protein [Clostridia bacterium]|nr:helix-turn-helix domain-containing protein [Clostridia bacterium]
MNLKELRLKNRLTQKQVADKVGVTTEYISQLERGIKNPSDNIKKQFVNLYNVDINQIFLAINQTQSFKAERG